MKTMYVVMFAGLVLGQAHPAARADTPATPPAESASSSASAPAGVTDPSADVPVSRDKLAERQVPKLTLRWGCGDCTQNEKVLPLIEQSYATQATAQGYSVGESETAELVITAYRQRNPGLRVMFGVMAGRDILATRVTFRGKEFIVSDYSANAFQGMNSLCEAVAQGALKQVVASIQAN